MSDRGGGEFLAGFVLGALAGAVAALLLAPSSGEQLRRDIERKSEELAEDAERLYEETRGQVTQLSERGRIVLQDNVKKAQQAVQEAQQKLGKTDEELGEVLGG
jgi:gas vesicle protein